MFLGSRTFRFTEYFMSDVSFTIRIHRIDTMVSLLLIILDIVDELFDFYSNNK